MHSFGMQTIQTKKRGKGNMSFYKLHIITILSFLIAIFGAIFISPYILVTLLCTFMIFLNVESFRKRKRNAGGKGE